MRWRLPPFAYAVAAVLVAAVAPQFARDGLEPAPFAYDAHEYAGVPREACPGASLALRITTAVRRTPVSVSLTRTVWSLAERRTVVPDRAPAHYNWLPGDEGSYTRTVRLAVPELPPGEYEFRGLAAAQGTRADYYRVRFAVPEGCPKGVG